MSKKRAINDVLSELTDALSDREKEVDAREEKLKKAEENFEVDRVAVYGNTKSSDVLHLNIGGTKVTVLRRTLTSVPGSMLASKFSGRWDDSLEKDKDGDFFINQEFSLFGPMLRYLLNKDNGTDTYPMNSPTKLSISTGLMGEENRLKDFFRMIEYYGMTNGIYPTNLMINTGSKESVEYLHPKKVNAKEWTTFRLFLDGHIRKVKSYEVTLGDDVKRIQIGWKHKSNTPANFNGNLGVGDVTETFALDMARSTLLIDGNGNPVDRLDHKKGTTIRSENYGKEWYVDGELLHLNKCVSLKGTHPLISIKGEMEITSIKLED